MAEKQELDEITKQILQYLIQAREEIEHEVDMDEELLKEVVTETHNVEQEIETKIKQENACATLEHVSIEYLQLARELYIVAVMGGNIGNVEAEMQELANEAERLEKLCNNEKTIEESNKRVQEAKDIVEKAESFRKDYIPIRNVLKGLEELS